MRMILFSAGATLGLQEKHQYEPHACHALAAADDSRKRGAHDVLACSGPGVLRAICRTGAANQK